MDDAGTSGDIRHRIDGVRRAQIMTTTQLAVITLVEDIFGAVRFASAPSEYAAVLTVKSTAESSTRTPKAAPQDFVAVRWA